MNTLLIILLFIILICLTNTVTESYSHPPASDWKLLGKGSQGGNDVPGEPLSPIKGWPGYQNTNIGECAAKYMANDDCGAITVDPTGYGDGITCQLKTREFATGGNGPVCCNPSAWKYGSKQMSFLKTPGKGNCFPPECPPTVLMIPEGGARKEANTYYTVPSDCVAGCNNSSGQGVGSPNSDACKIGNSIYLYNCKNPLPTTFHPPAPPQHAPWNIVSHISHIQNPIMGHGEFNNPLPSVNATFLKR